MPTASRKPRKPEFIDAPAEENEGEALFVAINRDTPEAEFRALVDRPAIRALLLLQRGEQAALFHRPPVPPQLIDSRVFCPKELSPEDQLNWMRGYRSATDETGGKK